MENENLTENQIKMFNGMRNRIKELKQERDLYIKAIYEILADLWALPVFVRGMEWRVDVKSISKEEADLIIKTKLSMSKEILKDMEKHIKIPENKELNKLFEKYLKNA